MWFSRFSRVLLDVDVFSIVCVSQGRHRDDRARLKTRKIFEETHTKTEERVEVSIKPLKSVSTWTIKFSVMTSSTHYVVSWHSPRHVSVSRDYVNFQSMLGQQQKSTGFTENSMNGQQWCSDVLYWTKRPSCAAVSSTTLVRLATDYCAECICINEQ